MPSKNKNQDIISQPTVKKSSHFITAGAIAIAATTSLHYLYNKQYYSKKYKEYNNKISENSKYELDCRKNIKIYLNILNDYPKHYNDEMFTRGWRFNLLSKLESEKALASIASSIPSVEEYNDRLNQANIMLSNANIALDTTKPELSKVSNYLLYTPTAIIVSSAIAIADLFQDQLLDLVNLTMDTACNLAGFLCDNQAEEA